jgi:chromosome segregation ATPase
VSKFKSLDSYPAAPVELTASRRQLAELIEARDEASAELTTLTARVHRLDRAKETIAPLESELIALDQTERFAMTRWSELDDSSAAPVSDAKRRTKIEAALLTARAQARAADGATAGLMPQVERTGARIRALALHIQQAAANVVVEDAMSSLFPQVKESIAAAEAVRGRIVAVRNWMANLTNRAEGEAEGPIRLNFEAFDREFNEASGRPLLNADMGEWFSFASRLAADHTATL